MRKVAIFSPAAGGNVGHGFIYAYKLCTYLKTKSQIQLFTIDDPKRIQEFRTAGINLTISKRFKAGRIDKKRFNKFGLFTSLAYGIYRIYYSYILLKEFYHRLDECDIFHLFEFEYTALFIYSLTNIKDLKKSILGIHIADFKWIHGRSISVNIYKSLLKKPVSWMMKNCLHTTTHGETTKEYLMKDFSLNPGRISSLQYGCEIRNPDISKNEARHKIGLMDEKRKIALFFGVFRKDKGLIQVIQNLKRINEDIVLLIAGSEGNISLSTIEESIQKEGIGNRVHTRFKYFDEDEIKYYFYASDLVLIPHTGDHLAFSGPLSLAVEYCRPVVASNIGEIGAFVSRYSIGMTFSPDNWDDFVGITNKIYKELKSYPELHFLGVQERVSWEEMGKQIYSIYVIHSK